MLKKLDEMKYEPPIILPKSTMAGPRASQRSSIQSVNSFSMASSFNLDPKTRSSQLHLPKTKPKFDHLAQTDPLQPLHQKMQNVSCLYTNFIFKNQKKNFIDQVKLERYRIMLENQRLQKNQLLKDLTDIKAHLAQTEKQKSTVMFAYRTLQEKIKERQKLMKAKMRQLNATSSANKKDKVTFNLCQDGHAGSMTSVFMEEELVKSRQLLTLEGVLNLDDQGKKSQENLGGSGNDLGRQHEKPDGINLWQGKMQKWQQMQSEIVKLRELKPNIQWLQLTNQQLQQQKEQLQQQLQQQKAEHCATVQKLCQSNISLQQVKLQVAELTSQISTLTQTCSSFRTKCEQQEREDTRKKSIIADLENTKYSYLMKEEKEKQEIELLKKFTQNLHLNDQKITEFIQTTFGSKVQSEPNSENKLFKEDISYILHLIKKKQHIYNQLINEYQEKHRETQTRSFLLEKRLHLTDTFIHKLDLFLGQQIQHCQMLRNIQVLKNNQLLTNGKKMDPANKSPEGLTLSKAIQTLQALIENYHLSYSFI